MNTSDEILNKLFRYCAYQERCKQDIRKKLYELDAVRSEYDDIIDYLEEEGFLNEARFAESFAGGKFRVKRWGKIKIQTELRKRKIAERLIERAFKREIPDSSYQKTLEYLLEKKVSNLQLESLLIQKQKTFRYLQQKGYEWEWIQAVWENYIAGNESGN